MYITATTDQNKQKNTFKRQHTALGAVLRRVAEPVRGMG